jgi:SAM-dependent methyltransferase
MYLSPRPLPVEMERYYPAEYGPHRYHDGGSAGSDTSAFRRLLRRLAFGPDWLKWLPQPQAGARLLELGCADGSLLKKLRSAGWTVAGVETARGPVARARERHGLEVFHGELRDAKFPDAHFDVVIGGMVLEHLHDPLGCVREIRRILKPDGLLVLAVPNIGSIEFRVFRGWWHGLELPRHLYHFTPKTIRRLLGAGGFSTAGLWWPRNPNNIIYSVRYMLEAIHDRPGVNRILSVWRIDNGALRYLLSPVAATLSWFHTSGRMVIVARPCEPVP